MGEGVTTSPEEEPRLVALVDLLGRTGASEFQIRYCEEEVPTIWMAAARWDKIWQAAGAMAPYPAVLRLAQSVMDGGHCRHCDRPSGVDDEPLDDLTSATSAIICWYRFDPEMSTFRRSCEGAAP